MKSGDRRTIEVGLWAFAFAIFLVSYSARFGALLGIASSPAFFPKGTASALAVVVKSASVYSFSGKATRYIIRAKTLASRSRIVPFLWSLADIFERFFRIARQAKTTTRAETVRLTSQLTLVAHTFAEVEFGAFMLFARITWFIALAITLSSFLYYLLISAAAKILGTYAFRAIRIAHLWRDAWFPTEHGRRTLLHAFYSACGAYASAVFLIGSGSCSTFEACSIIASRKIYVVGSRIVAYAFAAVSIYHYYLFFRASGKHFVALALVGEASYGAGLSDLFCQTWVGWRG